MRRRGVEHRPGRPRGGRQQQPRYLRVRRGRRVWDRDLRRVRSDRRRPVRRWPDDTPLTSTAYAGTDGRMYAFYVLATDLVGYQQLPPAVPRESTWVAAAPTSRVQTQIGLDLVGERLLRPLRLVGLSAPPAEPRGHVGVCRSAGGAGGPAGGRAERRAGGGVGELPGRPGPVLAGQPAGVAGDRLPRGGIRDWPGRLGARAVLPRAWTSQNPASGMSAVPQVGGDPGAGQPAPEGRTISPGCGPQPGGSPPRGMMLPPRRLGEGDTNPAEL